MKTPSFEDTISYCTVIINTDVGTGTGVFFSFNTPEERPELTIITNSHVLEDASTIELVLNKIINNNEEIPEKITIHNIQKAIIYHPNIDVDLW